MKRCTREPGMPTWLLGTIRCDDNEARRGNPDTGLGVNLSGAVRKADLSVNV